MCTGLIPVYYVGYMHRVNTLPSPYTLVAAVSTVVGMYEDLDSTDTCQFTLITCPFHLMSHTDKLKQIHHVNNQRTAEIGGDGS